MKTFKKLLISTVLLTACNLVCAAAANPLSVHVLNITEGLPSPNVKVTLERYQDGKWQLINSGETNEQGRISALYPAGQSLKKGKYRIVFMTGDWFHERKIDTFFSEIPVVIQVDGKLDHYHVPLLLSPYGFSTYRGN